MKTLIGTLSILLLASILAYTQQTPANRLTATESRTDAAPVEAAALSVEALPSLPFAVEKPSDVRFPAALALRIYNEAMHEVRWQLNPQHPATIVLVLTLRLGQPANYVETIYAPTRSTVISMKKWDELIFARLVSRAMRNSLLSDQQLDDIARAALTRARAQVSVQDLRAGK